MVYNKQGRFAEETIMRGRSVAIWEKAAKTDILAGAGMSDLAIMMLIESYAILGRHGGGSVGETQHRPRAEVVSSGK